MANDIKILWDDDYLSGDIEFDNGDLTRESGLETSILMSLFANRRADLDDTLPDPDNDDRQGWWGDQVSEYEDDQIGSKLWLLSRSKTDQDTLIKAESYAKESLQWLLDDGVSAKNEVDVYRLNRPDGSATLALHVKIYQSNGSVTEMQFDDLWASQLGG